MVVVTKRTCSVDGCERPHNANGLCGMHNIRVWRRGTTDLPPPRTRQKCIYEGCDRWRSSHGYCATHWARIQRNGDLIVRRPGRARSGKPTILKSGYLMLYEPEHPLASKSGQVLEHRKVLYDDIGDGDHPCFHCGRTVTWGASRPARLDVDHLDGNRQNNARSNLAPACPPCNDQRRTP